MSRAVWFAAGAGAAVYTMVRARRAAELLTPEGLEDRVHALIVGARVLREEIAQGRADAEPVLRERLRSPAPGVRLELGPAGPESPPRADAAHPVPHRTQEDPR
ncbi:DUF6167 family protein [Nocardioides sp. TRM66260-LWL]|uniref:DUF6167 family protein n=1 Tax=Nocardioides sp. TRM66260-LWL TaxID=2874478 RepID=UPI001CC42269|nr:DUF6167 family protein [Nocardioides sp. TRM66260-LWL]MBZ5733824.1 DUF6167 family protein [Nocardioides sp. TRM66260-LWL]